MNLTTGLLARARAAVDKLRAENPQHEKWIAALSDALSVLEEKGDVIHEEVVSTLQDVRSLLPDRLRVLLGDDAHLKKELDSYDAAAVLEAMRESNERMTELAEKIRAREEAWKDIASKLGTIGLRVAQVAIALA